MRPDAWVAGVDGCRSGWAVVWRRLDGVEPPAFSVAADFAGVLADPRAPVAIALDMPIGLPERVGPGGRGAERAVRPLLGARQSSVFSVPSRSAVMMDDYGAACAAAAATSDPPRKVAKQCFHLFPRIREVDALMSPALEDRVFEAHPELAFWQLNGGRAMTLPKKLKGGASAPGLAERAALLAAHGFAPGFLDQPLPRGTGRNDLLDAAVLSLTAARIARGEARSFPAEPDRDGRGLRIAIWA